MIIVQSISANHPPNADIISAQIPLTQLINFNATSPL